MELDAGPPGYPGIEGLQAQLTADDTSVVLREARVAERNPL